MDFARKQLEKYGWTDGKGLGKYENGISQALKPKLKRGVTGIGHDAAAEFTEHWWTKLYNTAASNVEVTEKNGKTKKIKSKDADFEITNSTWSYKKKNKTKSKKEYTNFFVKTSILTNGGVKTEDLEEPENLEVNNGDVVKLTDEELFAACEGRTAHKGARHGVKALGKLARIEMQEQMLLQQTKYNGYSKPKKHKANNTVEDGTILNNSEDKDKRQKKKTKDDCSSHTEVSRCTENFKHVKDKWTNSTTLEANLYNTAESGGIKCGKKKNLLLTHDTETNVECTPLEVKKKKIKKCKLKTDKPDDNETINAQETPIRNNDGNNIVTVEKQKKSDVMEYLNVDVKAKKSKKKSK
ncbi:G patch domain-containing protein 4 [Pieris napi]|uniref:G patch domain-containing protein 4 n=1 Tax=Pieris napi TaxID=78633 RepID=UPI001FBBE1CF|nr:G patch domain-containing protein 4 [Pieris napi]